MLSPRIAIEQGISESASNARAHAVVQHMMLLLRYIRMLHGATQGMSEAIDANG